MAATNAYYGPPGRTIGVGSYGQVMSVPSHPRRVLKICRLKDTDERCNFARETHFLQAMQSLQYLDPVIKDYRRVVPRLYDVAILDREMSGLHLMERMVASIHDLGCQQAQEYGLPKHELAYTWEQLCQIRRLVLALDAKGIVHGDLKRRNILYRDEEDGQVSMAVSDFGFSGYAERANGFYRKWPPRIGYPVTMKTPNPTRGRLPSWLTGYLNRWHMYYDLLVPRSVYLIIRSSYGVVRLREGFLRRWFSLPRHIVARFWALFATKDIHDFERDGRRRGTRVVVRNTNRPESAGNGQTLHKQFSGLVDGTGRA